MITLTVIGALALLSLIGAGIVGLLLPDIIAIAVILAVISIVKSIINSKK